MIHHTREVHFCVACVLRTRVALIAAADGMEAKAGGSGRRKKRRRNGVPIVIGQVDFPFTSLSSNSVQRPLQRPLVVVLLLLRYSYVVGGNFTVMVELIREAL